jgi:hypothetical protein
VKEKRRIREGDEKGGIRKEKGKKGSRGRGESKRRVRVE